MTDYTPEEIALAKESVITAYRNQGATGYADRLAKDELWDESCPNIAFKAALAAIKETTERCAKLVEAGPTGPDAFRRNAAALQSLPAASPDVEAGPVVQFRKAGCADWYDGYPDNQDGGGPYETRTLYAHPPKASPPATEIEARLRKTAADMIGNYDGEHDHWAELLTEAADALATKDREIAQAWREGWDAAKTLPLTDDLAQARNEALEEAANACDVSAEGWREAGFYNRSFAADNCATVIRNLKSPADADWVEMAGEREKERASIVAWLKRRAAFVDAMPPTDERFTSLETAISSNFARMLTAFADAIQSGEHLNREGNR